mmetsp:Transcript_3011/g.7231  ORF Transcript_3011/g.7231 Transcript_3011/m.7231 type:complete len:174 (+) Transcript_3011:2588-3109(+)
MMQFSALAGSSVPCSPSMWMLPRLRDATTVRRSVAVAMAMVDASGGKRLTHNGNKEDRSGWSEQNPRVPRVPTIVLCANYSGNERSSVQCYRNLQKIARGSSLVVAIIIHHYFPFAYGTRYKHGNVQQHTGATLVLVPVEARLTSSCSATGGERECCYQYPISFSIREMFSSF